MRQSSLSAGEAFEPQSAKQRYKSRMRAKLHRELHSLKA